MILKTEQLTKIIIVACAIAGTTISAWVYVNFGIKVLAPALVILGVFALTLFFRDVKTPFFYMLVILLPVFVARYLVPPPEEPEHTGLLNLPVLYAYEIPLYLYLFVWLLEFLSGRRPRLFLPPLTSPLALLFVPAALATATGMDSSYGLFELLRMVEMFLFFLVVVNYLKTDRQLKIVIGVLGADIAFQSFLAVLQFLAPYTMYDILAKFGIYMGISHARPYDPTSPVRACGTTGYCNSLAGFLELTVPLFVSLLYFYPTSVKYRRAVIAVLLTAIVALLLTYSRGGLISMAIAIFALLILSARRFPHLRRRALRITLVAAAQLIIILALFANQLLIRLQFFMKTSMEDDVRVALIRNALVMIKNHPVLGVGLNNYPEAFPLYEVTGMKFEMLYPVHNTWLLITAEQGFVGLAFFVLFMVFIFSAARRVIRSSSPLHAAVGLGLTAGLIGWFFHNLVAPLYQNWLINRMTFIFVIGLLAVIPRLVNPEGETTGDAAGSAAE